jgi:hypothetical protein
MHRTSPRWSRAALAALALLGASCSQPVTPFPFEYLLLGYLHVVAQLADANGAPTGLRALTNADSVKVRLLGDGDSTRTIDGQYLFSARNGNYSAAAEVGGVPTDSTRVIRIQDVDVLTTDTLKVFRQGDLAAGPNPFQASTTLRFALAADDSVTIEVVTLAGSRVRSLSGNFLAGLNSIVWDGLDDAGQPAANGWYVVTFVSSTERRLDVLIKEP